MNKARFDLIVFDWDGTLMDSTAAVSKCLQAAARDVGLPVPTAAQANSIIGIGLPDAIPRLFPEADARQAARLVERYRYHYLAQDQSPELFDGVRGMLEDLSGQGYFLAVATGMSRVGLARALNGTGLLSVFDATRCADETFSKPHPAMLQELTRELGQDLRRTVMIGDTTHDLLMARNAGSSGVAVKYGAHPPHELLALAPEFAANDVAELHAWLNEHA